MVIFMTYGLSDMEFNMIRNRGLAMMIGGNVPKEKKYLLFRKAFETVTLLDGPIVTTIDGVTAMRCEHWSGSIPGWAKWLRTWGEAGVIKSQNNRAHKLEPKG